jgi:hypothetical protein
VADRGADRAFMTAWLAGPLTGGDRIVADVRGYTGPSLRWDLALAAPLALAGALEALRNLFGGAPSDKPALAAVLLLLAGSVWSTCSVALHRPVYVAVTERQVIVVRMRRQSEPVRILLAAPLGALRLTTTDRLAQRSVTCAAADGGALLIGGKPRTRLRVKVHGRRARFEDVLSAILAQGGAVNPPALPAVPVPDSPG